MTAYARTPSVAATVTGLRTRGHGATYEPASPVKVAGLPGVQFDGQRILTAGKTVVVFLDSVALTADQFLRFPR